MADEYVATHNHNSDPTVIGPTQSGVGSYYHNTEYTSEEETKRTAYLANQAYDAGYKKCQLEMRIQLGIDT